MRITLPHIGALLLVLTAILAGGCSSTKHVPDGSYLLDKVEIDIDDRDDVSKDELYYFLRQVPNHKVLGFARLQLSTYSLAGRDSTKWYNRWLKRIGQPPTIYDRELTEASARQLRQAMINNGYLDARVVADTAVTAEKKIKVTYHVIAGEPHRVEVLEYNIPDPAIRRLVLNDTSGTLLHPGMLLDRTTLDNERARITRILRNNGYYDFNRDYINYIADTIKGSNLVGLTLNLRDMHRPYRVGHIYFVLEDNKDVRLDTVQYRGMTYLYGPDRFLRPQVLDEMCHIKTGQPYRAAEVERTYEALGRLAILKYINIEMIPAPDDGPSGLLDAYIFLSRGKKQSVSIEGEGTNSEGDFGFGAGVTYQHRNIGRGSELLSVKLRASYESLSGNFENLVNNRYTEYAGEVGLTFPKFKCPFLSRSYKQRVLASTEFSLSTNYQQRPEYTRVILGTAWKWKWEQKRLEQTRRHVFNLIDINYVRLPRSTINFIDEIAPTNPLLRYSYEDHFIMMMGYTFSRTNRRQPDAVVNSRAVQPHITTLRLSAETAGNVLYGISHLVHQQRSDGVYKILGIQYAQYVKGEADYSYTRNINERNSISLHGGLGIAFPYGNSSMVPFEKRFYAGGANGVRGWGVRTLGPGSYDARNSVTDFINQCGDIRLDMSIEYRAKLFWVFEGALFIDAGNIWTIKNYPNQPGGEFHFNRFYKQIAASYGLGLRMDFTYFLLRLDVGFKAHNPAMNQQPWPLLHPRLHRDANLHFSVGYPF